MQALAIHTSRTLPRASSTKRGLCRAKVKTKPANYQPAEGSVKYTTLSATGRRCAVHQNRPRRQGTMWQCISDACAQATQLGSLTRTR